MQQTISFSDEEQANLRDLTHVLGIPEEHVMKLALRRLAMAEGVVKHPATNVGFRPQTRHAGAPPSNKTDAEKDGATTMLHHTQKTYRNVPVVGSAERPNRMAYGADELQRRLEQGQRLKAVRLAMGYSNAADFCREINRAAGIPNPSATEGLMTSQRLNNYERGRAAARLGDELLPILYDMGISTDYLITGDVACLPPDIQEATISHLRAIRAAESP